MKKINAVGDSCPIPVIKMKKALEEAEIVEMLVDNEIATQNLEKLAVQKGYHYNLNKLDVKKYQVIMSQGEIKKENISTADVESTFEKKEASYVVVIDSDQMGRGDERLGRTLLKGFIYALSEQERLPKQLIMYNGGVKLSTSDADSFYELAEQVTVGEITNMYHIVELLSEADKIIKP